MNDASYRPGWYRLTWFLGRPPPLTQRQWRVLGLVAIVSLFEQYDLYLFALNLKQIQADLAIAEQNLGLFGALVRGGALLAVFVTVAADRLGRRRLLLITVIAYTLLTGATAFAQDAVSFVTLQFLARGFATAEVLIAAVVICEEFAPEHRGWGIGALGAIQACGAGLAALMFGLVDVLPYGWRALYVIGLGPLLLVAWWRRSLPETERFVSLQREHGEALRSTPALGPLLALVRNHPGRFTALAGAAFVVGLAAAPATFFAPKYLQDVHGWSPAGVAIVIFGGGALGIIGNPVAGWLSDRHGRRPIGALFSVAFAMLAMAFYAASGLLLPLLWVCKLFAFMGSEVTLTAFGAELFPTSQRSSASGLRSAASNTGGVAGLVLVSLLFGGLGSTWAAITALCLIALLAPMIILAAFPETAGRTLEEIAPEDVA